MQNGAGDLKEIPALSWADLKFWYEPDFAGPKDAFRHGATHWHALRFKRKAVLALWPDPFDQPDDHPPAEEQPAPPAASTDLAASKHKARTVDDHSSVGVGNNPFKGMDGLTWRDITMTFIADNEVRIKARGTNRTFTFEAIGFKRNNTWNATPTRVWETLRTLAIVTSSDRGRLTTFRRKSLSAAWHGCVTGYKPSSESRMILFATSNAITGQRLT